jgi:glycosyltransferase involved in cell wall biosynthesis
LDQEVALVQGFDIGLSPLADTEWERGKCALKALLYMACEVPIIGSPVGIQARIIRESGGGILAASPMEWVNAIEMLSEDAAMRNDMGAKGRKYVEENYSLKVWRDRWVTFILEMTE